MNGLETLLEGVTGFSANQVSQEDYSILNRGVTRAIVLVHGGFKAEKMAFSRSGLTDHLVQIQLFEKYTKPSATTNALRDDAQLVKLRIDAYPKLNGVSGVYHTELLAFDGNILTPTQDVPGLLQRPHTWRVITLQCLIREHESTAHVG